MKTRIPDTDTQRWCAACEQYKDFIYFGTNKAYLLGLHYTCKECLRERGIAKRRAAGMQPKHRRPVGEEGTKWCSGCKDFYTLEKFHNNKSSRDGLMDECKKCMAKRDKKRDYYLRKYGITKDEVRQMRGAQDNRCAICLNQLTDRGDRRACLDHCHQTGKIRKIICHKCNIFLGQIQDRHFTLEDLQKYLSGKGCKYSQTLRQALDLSVEFRLSRKPGQRAKQSINWRPPDAPANRISEDGLSKWCSSCKMWKNLEFFPIIKVRSTTSHQCLECKKLYDNNRNYYERVYALEEKYVDQMIAEQNSQCACCPAIPNKLYVDHCHETLRIRGMLCRGCNSALGFIDENIDILASMRQYLELFQ